MAVVVMDLLGADFLKNRKFTGVSELGFVKLCNRLLISQLDWGLIEITVVTIITYITFKKSFGCLLHFLKSERLECCVKLFFVCVLAMVFKI